MADQLKAKDFTEADYLELLRENKSLHIKLAGATLRADQGWERYESANKAHMACLNTRAEPVGVPTVQAGSAGSGGIGAGTRRSVTRVEGRVSGGFGAAPSQPVAGKDATECGWLVENGCDVPGLRYRTMDNSGIAWTDDHNKAIRFARRADAEMFAAEDEDAWRIVQHGWDNAAPPTQAIAVEARNANNDLLTYVLQDDVHNRLTPRVIDIAYTAFMQAKQPNDEDGGASDWFTDTRPVVLKAIEKLRKDLLVQGAKHNG